MNHRVRLLVFSIAILPMVLQALRRRSPRATSLPRRSSLKHGAEAGRLTLDMYLEMETVSDPQLSPDGSQIIYTRGWIDKMNDKRESALWIMNADGTRNRFLVKGSGAQWSPTGDRIAFAAPGEPKGSQLFVRWMDAEGATSQVTRVEQSPTRRRVVARRHAARPSACCAEDRNTWTIKMPKAPARRQVDRGAAHRRAPASTGATAPASPTTATATSSSSRRSAGRRGS